MTSFGEYHKFNQWVYERFFAPTIDTYAHIASIFIDVSEAEKCIYFRGACNFLSENDWHQLCHTQPDDVPLYLGLIAIQLFVASSRHDDGRHRSRNYNARLYQCLSITENELQAKYRDAQEDIYSHFENWSKRHNFSIYLAKDGYRYVQYPLSLALLHKKDLESLSLFFHKCGLAPNDEIDFECFKNNIRVGSLPPGIYQKWNRLSETGRKEAVLKQMYSSYLNWDGQYQENERHDRSRNSPQSKDYSMYWARSTEIAPEFYCNREFIEFPFVADCFFIQDPVNMNDWEYCLERHVKYSQDTEYVFVYTKETSFSKDLRNFLVQSPYCYGNLNVIHLLPPQISKMIKLFPEKFKNVPSLRLAGGIRINHREWMDGAGPIIVADDTYASARLSRQGKQESPTEINIAEQPLIHLPVGRYFLRYSPEMPAIHFRIVALLPHENREEKCGWDFSENGCRVTDKSPHIHGLDFSKIPKECLRAKSHQYGNLVRYWMELTLGVSNQSYDNENIIHKTLRRSIDGIRNR